MIDRYKWLKTNYHLRYYGQSSSQKHCQMAVPNYELNINLHHFHTDI
jgi:hypothetical protein